ncbi:hypothetical protein QBC32DRAFT_141773 [Pseudoneurospora amorphoporcata]|uniref:Uncharacterized protein n=1 Tax=Pseudoneurospora amorphoporcata TaxID=241081 RepID=A0AAN6SA13_9PEZI|nr:hypothetical protein QBC32DRAFT_141773 [Pseudoneurospora amorphoporcata]
MLNRLPLTGLLAIVLTILGETVWILHIHLKAIKSQDDPIPLPSDLYIVIVVLVKSTYECVDRDLRTVCPFLPKTPPSTPSARAPGTSNTRTNTGTGTDLRLEEYNTTPPLIIIFTAWKSGRYILVCLSFATAALEFWALFLGTLQVSASSYGSRT